MEAQAFQDAVVRLGHLSMNGMSQGFIEEYRKVITEIYNDMMSLQHIGRIRSGLYIEQGKTLMAILKHTMTKSGIDWENAPDPRTHGGYNEQSRDE